MTNCIFCKIVARTAPSHVVFEDDELLAFLDIHPIRDGHTLIVPKVHYESFEDMPSGLMAKIANTAQLVARHMKRIYNPLRVGMAIAGTDVPHMHAHVCPILEKYDLTSARYITSPNPTFAMPPRASDRRLASTAIMLKAALAGG
jgi:histidine triad (HIT) family protein